MVTTGQGKYIHSTLEKNPSTWRMWKDKPREVLEILFYDTALGMKVGRTFVEDALNADFMIVDNDDNPDEQANEKTTEKVKDKAREIYTRARGAQRWFSYSVVGMFDFEEGLRS